VITVNLKKGVFNPEYFKNIVFGFTTSREILAGKAQHTVDRFFLMSKGHNIVYLQGYRPHFNTFSVEHDEPWEGARIENTVLEGLWRMNERGA